MKNTTKNILVTISLSTSFLLSASTINHSHAKDVNEPAPSFKTMSVSPTPKDKATLESQLKRYKGQTEFLNILYAYKNVGRSAPGMPSAPESALKSGDAREQQESDVYKVGLPGSKLLYLLNDYRGLQAVSFKDGVLSPQLLGRVEASGNYPEDMYFIKNQKNILVLERNFYDEDTDRYSYSTHQSRIVSYSVENPEKPVQISIEELEGEVADSRLVGDILYIATSLRPSWYDRENNVESNYKGFIYSYKVSQKNGVSLVQKQELSLPVSSRENMNIVEEFQNGVYKYYLIATLNKNAWSWWDRQTVVEVVDISDPQGSIQPIMSVSVKGMVRERSQTTIKDGTLIVTSNFMDREVTDGRAQIEVEAFTLPTPESEKIEDLEFQFRKLKIERELKGLAGEARDVKLKTLLADKEYGLLGRFVKSADGKLQKMTPDQTLNLRDTTGLHTFVQDVRYVGNLLYIFWVPQNNIDPFDLVDISKPAQELKFIKRLQFEGWMERSIPLQYEGRELVLGLGWEIAAVDNPRGNRYPKAILFEIKRSGDQVKQDILAEMTLKEKNFWSNFNDQDKYMEVKMGADGKGSLLFAGSATKEGKHSSGAKLIGFDLKAAIDGRFSEAFAEGAFLSGNPGWIKRVFSNPEIEKINSFSNKALATYDVTGVGTADAIADAVSILELSRNIQNFEILKNGNQSYGLQIVSDFSWYNSDSSQTSLRLVPYAAPDAEVSSVLSQVRVPGSYRESIKVAEDKMLILSEKRRWWYEEDVYKQEHFYYLSEVTLLDGKLETKLLLTQDQAARDGAVERSDLNIMGSQFVKLKDGNILLYFNGNLKWIQQNADRSLSIKEMKTQNCKIEDKIEPYLQLVGDQLILASKIQVQDPERKTFMYSRNTIAKVALTETEAVCGPEINIPGRLINILSDGYLVTQDQALVSSLPDPKELNADEEEEGGPIPEAEGAVALDSPVIGMRPPWYSHREIVKTKDAFLILSGTLDSENVVLRNDYELKRNSANALERLESGELFFLSEEVQESYGWNPWGGGRGGYTTTDSKFVILGFEEGDFVESFVYIENLPTQAEGGIRLLSLEKDPKSTNAESVDYLALVSKGRQVFSLSFNTQKSEPTLNKLSADGKVDSLKLKNSWNVREVNFDPETRSYFLSLGDLGAQSLTLY